MKNITIIILLAFSFLSCERNDKDITNKITILPILWEYASKPSFNVDTESETSILNTNQYIKIKCAIPRNITQLVPVYTPDFESGSNIITLDLLNVVRKDELHFYYVIEKKETNSNKYHSIKPIQAAVSQDYGTTIMTDYFYYATTKFEQDYYANFGNYFFYECKIAMTVPGNYRVKIINPTISTNQYLEITNTASTDISPFDLKIFSIFQANSETITNGYFYFEVL